MAQTQPRHTIGQHASASTRAQPPPRFSFLKTLIFGPAKWTIVARTQNFGVTAAIFRRPATMKTHGKYVYRVGVWKSFKPTFGKWRTTHELYYSELIRGLASLAECQKQVPIEE